MSSLSTSNSIDSHSEYRKHRNNQLSVDELNPISPEPFTLEPSGSPGLRNTDDHPILRKVLRYLQTVQKYSAYTMLTFTGLHVSSVIVMPGVGMSWHICQEVFEMSRNVYHGIPMFEPLCIWGAGLLHVGSGVSIRYIRQRILLQNKIKEQQAQREQHNHEQFLTKSDEIIIKDDSRRDIGLGGLTGLLGLGYKKSMVSTWWPSLSPLSFSGYVLLGLLVVHVWKFRIVPRQIDGDSSLITLDFVGYAIHKSALAHRGGEQVGRWLNTGLLLLLSWVGSYHVTSGVMRFTRKFSLKWKKLGYAVINGVFACSCVAMYARYRHVPVSGDGFVGKAFMKYINAFLF